MGGKTEKEILAILEDAMRREKGIGAIMVSDLDEFRKCIDDLKV